MEKRLLIASILSAVFLSFYSSVMIGKRPTPSTTIQAKAPESQRGAQPAGGLLDPVLRPPTNEEIARIESEQLVLEIGQATGSLRSATLKAFSNGAAQGTPRFGVDMALLDIRVDDEPLTCHVVSESQSELVLEGSDPSKRSYRISYALLKDPWSASLTINPLQDTKFPPPVVTLVSGWEKDDELSQRYNSLEVGVVMHTASGSVKHKRFVAPFKNHKNVPRGTSLVSLAERYFCLLLKPEYGTLAVSLLPSEDQNRVFVASSLADSAPVSARVYIGPRDYFVLKKAGLESAFPIGMLGQIGLILLMILSWLAGLTKSYGVAVILFSTLVTVAMAPMTLISLRSMKKMQELKPQMDRIMATHKGDTMRANQEMVALYRQHKVSPLSGCLPMVMQFPIFIALFQAMSHFIELRGRRFLWIQDLSLPDRIAQLTHDVPLIGRDINLLPILMAIAMVAQTKLSQQGQGASDANPTAKMLSGPLMPMLFCVMFYSFPSGLVLYWLTNTLISVAVYRMAYGARV